jgi:glycosyltransferase involved in cell wall biosynthesis
MKILYTVQRYGEDIVGGSEAACRAFAERIAGRGHEVEVVTSCARSYIDWADEYEPGTSELAGVTVNRLPVVAERSMAKFIPLNEWSFLGPRPMPLFQQQRWMQSMGPRLTGYTRWLSTNVGRFDAVIHMTYMYGTTTAGLPVTAGRVPTLLQPTAHDEPALWVRQYDTLFRLPDAFMFFTPEERRIVADRFDFEPDGEVIGMGMDVHPRADPAPFRSTAGLGDAPYLLYVGRIDRSKGALEAFRFFEAYKQRNPGPLKFVLAGEAVFDLPSHPDVSSVGFLDEDTKRAALAGAVALVQPSYFESFSIVLCESWLQGRPALVQAGCSVLAGQARRSGGALAYSGFAEFEAALDLLLAQPLLADQLGEHGRRYVEHSYTWPRVVDHVEAAVERARDNHARRSQRIAGPSTAR